MSDKQAVQMKVVKRNGTTVDFNLEKIVVAITKAFLAVEGSNANESSRIHEKVKDLAEAVRVKVEGRLASNAGVIHIEDIQDAVELVLMRSGEQQVARSYVLYREKHQEKRIKRGREHHPSINILNDEGQLEPLNVQRIIDTLKVASAGLDGVDPTQVASEVVKNLYNGVKESDIPVAILMAARTRIEQEPNYSYVTARLLANTLHRDALKFLELPEKTPEADVLGPYLKKAVELKLLTAELLYFDIPKLAAAIDSSRTNNFTYLGLQTLADRYFIQSNEVRFELPQIFFMRVAMGLALDEDNREERAIQFYELLSSFDYMASTPTLFNAGTLKPQLSSCYLTTINDDLYDIYSSMRDNAMLSKWAGGLGNDWTPVRALNSYIKGTNGKSQGVVPFLKVANDTAVAVNQGGKRKGAICAYLESWHLDVEEFLELRKNTGDDRRRTHDMNTANWIPDLFMERVILDREWTLFTPSEAKDLHDLVGVEFRKRYEHYESVAKQNGMLHKKVKAKDLWRKMLSMLFETGHPWLTFKDVCNLRSPQSHVGVVHSSNLCTEITLNTSKDEIAVCNLGSINLVNHIKNGKLDKAKLEKTVRLATRMLDNVIDINFYPVPAAENSNLKHRPIGLGIMGFQDALYKLGYAYASDEAVEFADNSMELISYYAIRTSSELAVERGRYSSYKGSLWSKGILPIDSLDLVKASRAESMFEVDRSKTLDWDSLRSLVQRQGMRNSNVMAIAPTATISNICGVSQSIEPTFQNLYVKSNLSGEFTVINPYLVDALKKRGLWDAVMVNDLKHYEGSVEKISRIPEDLKKIFATAFEVDARWLIESASRRQKWIDQAQSLNLYISNANGRKLDVVYKMAWLRGLKTTYYLRALSATSAEKSTINTGALNAVKVDQSMDNFAAPASVPKACSIFDEGCEACQ